MSTRDEMTTSRYRRGTCPVCDRPIGIKEDGTMRDHGREKDTGDRWAKCAGYGQKPKEDAA